MNKKEFAKKIVLLVDGASIIEIDGKLRITRKVTNGVSPAIRIDDLYNKYSSINEAAEFVKSVLNTPIPEMDLEFLKSFESVKDKLEIRLYNENFIADIYRKADEYGFCDLILVPYIVLDDEKSIKVTKQLADLWNISYTEIIDAAINNTKYVTKKFTDFFMTDDFGVTIITNKRGIFGAAGIIKAEKEMRKRYPNGYYVLPSSIHEVLVVPRNKDASIFLNIVTEVNKECVEPNEFLSNNVYEF